MADGLTSALKLSRTNIHNISRKLKRQDETIQEYKAKIRHLTKANKAKSEEVKVTKKSSLYEVCKMAVLYCHIPCC